MVPLLRADQRSLWQPRPVMLSANSRMAWLQCRPDDTIRQFDFAHFRAIDAAGSVVSPGEASATADGGIIYQRSVKINGEPRLSGDFTSV